MSETLGTAIDKLATINQKLFLQQELIYKIKRMSFEEFHTYFSMSCRELYDGLHKLSDLNVQRNALINEVDEKIIALIQAGVRGEELDNGANVQRAHKTVGSVENYTCAYCNERFRSIEDATGHGPNCEGPHPRTVIVR